MTTQVNTFALSAIPKSGNAPTMPEALDRAAFHTRQEVRDYNNAVQNFYDHERNVARQIVIDADKARAKEVAEANREMSDAEYDAAGLKRFNDQRDKAAEREAKDKADELEKIAYMLSSPPTASVFRRSEYAFLKDFEHWISRGYSLGPDGMEMFQPGLYHVILDAPVAKKAGAK